MSYRQAAALRATKLRAYSEPSISSLCKGMLQAERQRQLFLATKKHVSGSECMKNKWWKSINAVGKLSLFPSSAHHPRIWHMCYIGHASSDPWDKKKNARAFPRKTVSWQLTGWPDLPANCFPQINEILKALLRNARLKIFASYTTTTHHVFE